MTGKSNAELAGDSPSPRVPQPIWDLWASFIRFSQSIDHRALQNPYFVSPVRTAAVGILAEEVSVQPLSGSVCGSCCCRRCSRSPTRPVITQITSGVVAGVVRDSQGGVIPGATVTSTSESRNTKLTPVNTRVTGDFVFPTVPADIYTLEVSLEGFSTLKGPACRSRWRPPRATAAHHLCWRQDGSRGMSRPRL